MSQADASATSRGDATTWDVAVFFLVFGGLLSAWPLLAMGGAVRPLVEENQLRADGVITTAVVVKSRERYDEDLHVTHFLSLAYKAPSGPGQSDHSFLREIEVSSKYYRSTPDSSAVPLRYVRTDPAVSRLEHHVGLGRLIRAGIATAFLAVLLGIGGVFILLGRLIGAGIAAAFLAVLLVIGGVFILLGLQCCSELIQLACFGRRIPGRVVNRWINTVCVDTHSCEEQHCISYCFQPPNGPAQLVEKQVIAEVYQGLSPGSEVLVEFVPQRPKIHRLVLR